MSSLDALRGRHAGETAYIVGKGPSLLCATADIFGPGPVITLNHAVLYVRRLNLPNPIYAFQKDGCRYHDGGSPYVPPGPDHECVGETVPLKAPETALWSAAESPHCGDGYEPRVIVDVEEFGCRWQTPSAPVATRIAVAMGCARIVFVSHDAHTNGDLRRVVDGISVQHETDLGYPAAGRWSQQYADDAGIPVEWVTPTC